MNLVELVKYREALERLARKSLSKNVAEDFLDIDRDLQTVDIDFNDLKSQITDEIKSVYKSLNRIETLIADYLDQYKDFYESTLAPYYALSHSFYEASKQDTPDYIFERDSNKKLIDDDSTRRMLEERIKHYTNWKWPGVQIRPLGGEFTQTLAPCDPLYLADTHNDLFQQVKEMWTPEYQRRLRYYVFDEHLDDPLCSLPESQIGIVFAVNFFNFRSMEIIQRYLRSFKRILRPGGVAMFTYNNCDLSKSVDLFANKSYYCFTPGGALRQMCIQEGFEVICSFDADFGASWLEIRKPGKIDSLRGGQNLAQIKTLVDQTK